MAYSKDDTFNVIEDHLTRALQDDTDLKTGGSLAITTWDQELRFDASHYQDNELPALISLAGVPSDGGMIAIDGMQVNFPIEVVVVISAADEQRRAKLAKEYLARVYRVLIQQHVTSKRLKALPEALDFAAQSSVDLTVTSGDFDSGEVQGVTRAVAVIEATVSIILTIGSGD